MDEFDHTICGQYTHELIRWMVAKATWSSLDEPLPDHLARWAIWYVSRHCTRCGACGDFEHITESGVCDSCLILEENYITPTA